jgi:lysophospholipid acyltransferase (LPLAT)-like uncharacterized protein
MISAETKFRAAGRVGAPLVRALLGTVRTEVTGDEELERFRRDGQPVIFALWHGQLLPLTHHHRDQGVTALVSEHADGEYITRIIMRLGFTAARGSSTRGGTAGLRGLLRAARAGRDLAITADGPRGPRHDFKPGALIAAKLTGYPIIPVACSASRAWVFNSWDRFILPKPFSRLKITYGEAVLVDRGSSDEELERLAARLAETLVGLVPPLPDEGA